MSRSELLREHERLSRLEEEGKNFSILKRELEKQIFDFIDEASEQPVRDSHLVYHYDSRPARSRKDRPRW